MCVFCVAGGSWSPMEFSVADQGGYESFCDSLLIGQINSEA